MLGLVDKRFKAVIAYMLKDFKKILSNEWTDRDYQQRGDNYRQESKRNSGPKIE